MENEHQLIKKLSNLGEGSSKELLKTIIQNALSEEEIVEKMPLKEKLQLLTKCRESLNLKYDFKEGDFVKWKKNLKTRDMPDYDEPAIVLEVLDKIVYDTEAETGSTYFREPLDIILGVIAEDGELIYFHYDKRRFEPFKKK